MIDSSNDVEENEPEEEEEGVEEPEGTGTQGQTGTSGVFDWLVQHPQFQTLRAMIQNNPQLLPVIMQQLTQANPELVDLIREHQNEFVQLLLSPVTPKYSYPCVTFFLSLSSFTRSLPLSLSRALSFSLVHLIVCVSL
jgi:hypothetical protein